MPTEPEQSARSRFWPAVPALLGISALTVYVAGQARELVPGTSARILNALCGLDPIPVATHRLYAWLAGAFAGLAPGSVFANLNLFSAVCAALSVVLLHRLMLQVAALAQPAPASPGSRAFAAQQIAALSAAVLFILCVPFWQVATRPDTAAFDLLILLACFVSIVHALRPQVRWAWIPFSVFLYGLGITEYATMIALAPAYALILVYVLLRRGQLTRSAMIQVLLAGCAGLLFYLAGPLHIARVPDYGFGRYEGFASVLIDVWKSQYRQIKSSVPQVGGILILLSAFVPWMYVLFMARPSHSASAVSAFSISLSLVLLAGLGGLLLAEIRASPFRLLGGRPVLLPYLSIVSWMGYLNGYWVLKFREGRRGDSSLFEWIQRGLATAMLAIAFLLPAAVATANAPRFYVRPASPLTEYVNNIHRSCAGRTLLFSHTPGLDDLVAQTAFRNGDPLRVISSALLGQPFYRNYVIATHLKSPPADGTAPAQVELIRQVIDAQPSGAASCAFLLPEMIYSLGFQFAPEGLVTTIVDDYARVNAEELFARNQRLFGEVFQPHIETLRAAAATDRVSAQLLLEYSRCANNLGTVLRALQADALAQQAYDMALEIFPENPNVLLNLYQLLARKAAATGQSAAERAQAETDAQDMLRKAHEVAQVQLGGRADPAMMTASFGYVYSEQVFVQLARQYRQMGLANLEQTAIEQARQIAPDSLLVFQGSAASMLGRGDLAGARADYDAILKRDPADAEARLGLAAIAFAEANVNDAIAILTDPAAPRDQPALKSMLSLMYLEAGDTAKAQAEFDAAAENKLKDSRALSFLALAAFRLADYDLAREYAERVLAYAPNSPQMIQVLYRVARLNNEHLRAHQFLTALRKFYPDDLQLVGDALYLDFALNRLDDARKDAEALLARDPDNIVATLALSDLAGLDEEYARQEELLRKVVSFKDDPRYPFTLNNLAYCLVRQGRSREALPFALEATTLDDANDAFRHTLSAAHLGLNQLKEAEAQVLLATTLSPDNANHKLLHAEILSAMRQPAEARKLLVEAMPDLEGAWRTRGKALQDKLDSNS